MIRKLKKAAIVAGQEFCEEIIVGDYIEKSFDESCEIFQKRLQEAFFSVLTAPSKRQNKLRRLKPLKGNLNAKI